MMPKHRRSFIQNRISNKESEEVVASSYKNHQLKAQEYLQKRRAIIEGMINRNELLVGKHLFKFSNKPDQQLSLTKSGVSHVFAAFQAEFGWSFETKVLKSEVDIKPGNAKPYVYYEMQCTIYNADGTVVAQGVGNAHSQEQNHMLKVSKDTAERLGYPTDLMTSDKYGKYNVADPNIGSKTNTIMKQAEKRANSQAVSLATGASDLFTQDFDTMSYEQILSIAGEDAISLQEYNNQMASLGNNDFVVGEAKIENPPQNAVPIPKEPGKSKDNPDPEPVLGNEHKSDDLGTEPKNSQETPISESEPVLEMSQGQEFDSFAKWSMAVGKPMVEETVDMIIKDLKLNIDRDSMVADFARKFKNHLAEKGFNPKNQNREDKTYADIQEMLNNFLQDQVNIKTLELGDTIPFDDNGSSNGLPDGAEIPEMDTSGLPSNSDKMELKSLSNSVKGILGDETLSHTEDIHIEIAKVLLNDNIPNEKKADEISVISFLSSGEEINNCLKLIGIEEEKEPSLPAQLPKRSFGGKRKT